MFLLLNAGVLLIGFGVQPNASAPLSVVISDVIGKPLLFPVVSVAETFPYPPFDVRFVDSSEYVHNSPAFSTASVSTRMSDATSYEIKALIAKGNRFIM